MTNAKRKIISYGVSKTETSFYFVLFCFENQGSFMEGRISAESNAMTNTEQRPRESNADSIDVHGPVMCEEW